MKKQFLLTTLGCLFLFVCVTCTTIAITPSSVNTNKKVSYTEQIDAKFLPAADVAHTPLLPDKPYTISAGTQTQNLITGITVTKTKSEGIKANITGKHKQKAEIVIAQSDHPAITNTYSLCGDKNSGGTNCNTTTGTGNTTNTSCLNLEIHKQLLHFDVNYAALDDGGINCNPKIEG